MSQRRMVDFSRMRSLVAVATVIAMALTTVAPAFSADMASFAGSVLAPDNSFASGFTVVFRDVVTGKEFRSTPTGPSGEYQASVPVGGKYKLDSVVAPDGTKLPVQNVPPISAKAAGSNRLDVKFTNSEPPPANAGTKPATAPTEVAKTTPPPKKEEKKNKGGSGVPWWKKPGPIVGIVLGAVASAALIVIAVSGSEDASPPTSVSPSTPPGN